MVSHSPAASRFLARVLCVVVLGMALFAVVSPASALPPRAWVREWPATDFSQSLIAFQEIVDGGPGRDGIPAIISPKFIDLADRYPIPLGENEPAIVVRLGTVTHVYPLRIMIRHEIVNDVVNGVPIVVTYCPLCNTAIAFERRLDDRILTFGVTGKLRNANLLMYDRETQSWWQQFTGQALVGGQTGSRLATLPAPVAPLSRIRKDIPDARILTPALNDVRAYRNPYVNYDSRQRPFPLPKGRLPSDVPPMSYVVVVEGRAWRLDHLSQVGQIVDGDLMLAWETGMNSALDHANVARGRDIGSVRVERRVKGRMESVPHEVTFAFVFRAFFPDGLILPSRS